MLFKFVGPPSLQGVMSAVNIVDSALSIGGIVVAAAATFYAVSFAEKMRVRFATC